MALNLKVNGKDHAIEADPATPLLYVLRNALGLNGPKSGCGLGQCGACTVQLDGEAVFSCLTPVAVVGDRAVVTVEGLGTLENSSILQKAFETEQAAQCGYCIAGMIMRAQALLDANPSPSETDIRTHMRPNLCRCGTHMRILRAIRRAAGIQTAGTETNPSMEVGR